MADEVLVDLGQLTEQPVEVAGDRRDLGPPERLARPEPVEAGDEQPAALTRARQAGPAGERALRSGAHDAQWVLRRAQPTSRARRTA